LQYNNFTLDLINSPVPSVYVFKGVKINRLGGGGGGGGGREKKKKKKN